MIFPLIPIPFGRIQLYQKPISMRFGERKLTQLCCQELGREPKTNELFLFYNTKRDALKLFWRDGNGSQEITKACLGAASCYPPQRMAKRSSHSRAANSRVSFGQK